MIYINEVLAWTTLALAFGGVLCLCAVNVLWRRKQLVVEAIYALLLVSLLFFLSGGVAFLLQSASTFYGLGLLTALFLVARIHIGRLPNEFLRRNTLQTCAVSLLFFVGVLVSMVVLPPISTTAFIIAIMFVALCLASWLGVQTAWALNHYVYDVTAKPASGGQVPTVTVAIPARNETLALAACLDAVLESNYQKLEIIVLDDDSHDNTSALIKSYAHAGVRFIQGETPSSGWLGKTNAYNQLAKEASGDIILFIGVDTHLQPETITRLVTYLEVHKLDMISILPRLGASLGLATFLQSLRYVWQIILPLTRRRVPVSSEAWAIRYSTLKALGGFSGVKHKIIPEGSFARRLMTTNRYHFVVANTILPMKYVKSWRSQQQTALRILYPTLKRRPLRTLGTIMLLLLCGLGPFIVAAFASIFSTAWWLALGTVLLYLLLYASVLKRLQSYWWLSMWFLPLVLLQEIILIFISMARYEFSSVDWKGRNVYPPVLLHRRR